MVEQSVLNAVRNYLKAVRRAGINVNRAILFGSYLRGEDHQDSDIDIIVVAPEFDRLPDERQIDLLWELRATTDSRIEPIAVGERQWEEDDTSPIIEIARREGKTIPCP